MPRDRRRRDHAVRITTAATARGDDIAARQRRYLLSMALRSACFVGAVVAGAGFGLWWLCWLLILGSLVLPYVAVVVANVAAPRHGHTDLLDTSYQHELGPAPTRVLDDEPVVTHPRTEP